MRSILLLPLALATIVEKHIQPAEYADYPTTYTKLGCWDAPGVPNLDWFLPIVKDDHEYSKRLPGEVAQFGSGDGRTKVSVYGRMSSEYLEGGSGDGWRVATQAYHVHHEVPGGYANWLLTLQPVYYHDEAGELVCHAQAILSPFSTLPRPASDFNLVSSSPAGHEIGTAIFQAIEHCDPKSIWPDGISFQSGQFLVKLVVRSGPSQNIPGGFALTAFFVAIDQLDKEGGSLMAILYPTYSMHSEGPKARLVKDRSWAYVMAFSPDYQFDRLAN